jgi:hypothetical protein
MMSEKMKEVERYVIERLKPCKCIYPIRFCDGTHEKIVCRDDGLHERIVCRGSLGLHERLVCYSLSKLEEAFGSPYWAVPEDSEYQFRSYIDSIVLNAAREVKCYPFYWEGISPITVQLMIKSCNRAIGFGDGYLLLLYEDRFVIFHSLEDRVYGNCLVIFPYDSGEINNMCRESAQMCRDIIESGRIAQIPNDILNVIFGYFALYSVYENAVGGDV